MQTIIHTFGGISEYPFKAIDPLVLDCLDRAAECLPKSQTKKHNVIKRTLECFLQVTDQTLDMVIMRGLGFADICTSYIGSLYSPTFFNISREQKYNLVMSFLQLVEKLALMYQATPVPYVQLSTARATEDVQQFILKFDRLNLNDDKLWLWRGWSCTNRKGVVYWAPLYPIYERLGKEFTQQLYTVCVEYVGARLVNRVPCLRELAEFILQYPENLDVNDFKRPEFMGRFWRSFLTYYLITEYAGGQSVGIPTLTSRWRHHFIPFVESYLIPSGLFAEPWGEIPAPPPQTVTGANTNIQTTEDGELVKVKLLTNIPLYVTDEEAMLLLFSQIRVDVEVATNWATWATNDIWIRYQSRLAQSTHGTVILIGAGAANNGRRWLTDRNNPDHFKNAAATITHYGHIDNIHKSCLLFPKPISQTAYELAMPTSTALIPHCILLVANHPSITTSFLTNLELYDKNGNQTGFVETDGSAKLIGNKMRRGSKLAQQIIALNDTTTNIVKQIIALTESIRKYLKSKGDDNWRYLLLSSKKGFGYPKKINNLSAGASANVRVQEFARLLGKTCSLNQDELTKYAKRFNLTALRASCGVLVYLETRSLREMSKALGHSELDIKLIRRYLPEPIIAYYQERWIRIFQAAILVEALKESDYLLEASGFKNIYELDIFLKTHALKLPKASPPEMENNIGDYRKNLKDEVVFGVNTTILTLLLSLQLAVQNAQKNVNEKARYWAEITHHLIEHLEKIETYRPDLQAYLENAKREANALNMEGIIYD